MDISIDLSKYTKQQLDDFIVQQIITMKEYYDELARRNEDATDG